MKTLGQGNECRIREVNRYKLRYISTLFHMRINVMTANVFETLSIIRINIKTTNVFRSVFYYQ